MRGATASRAANGAPTRTRGARRPRPRRRRDASACAQLPLSNGARFDLILQVGAAFRVPKRSVAPQSLALLPLQRPI